MKYMHNRGHIDMADRKVWCFLGDGEMDEPESLGARLTIAAREGLDNLIFVINCNLQRLDGPVRGNGKIVQELEGDFRGAGWNVIKLLWGKGWDELLENDTSGRLRQLMDETVDGDYQIVQSPRTAPISASISSANIPKPRSPGRRYGPTIKSGPCAAAVMILKRSTQPIKRASSTPRASPAVCWSRRSRAMAWARRVKVMNIDPPAKEDGRGSTARHARPLPGADLGRGPAKSAVCDS